MRVLVACEFSGVVSSAFRRRGHEAWSCDLQDTEDDPRWHLIGDVRGLVTSDTSCWDLLIAHPPCTYLCSSGLHWNKRVPGREQKTEEALEFFKVFLNSNIPRICIENPIGCVSTRIRKPDQTIQPWQFGHPESKATCLWLKGLPKLQPTNVLTKPPCGYWDNQTPSGQSNLPETADRAKTRSRTYFGIGEAMAEQWGELNA